MLVLLIYSMEEALRNYLKPKFLPPPYRKRVILGSAFVYSTVGISTSIHIFWLTHSLLMSYSFLALWFTTSFFLGIWTLSEYERIAREQPNKLAQAHKILRKKPQVKIIVPLIIFIIVVVDLPFILT